jgi:hypothetical protein
MVDGEKVEQLIDTSKLFQFKYTNFRPKIATITKH